MKDLTLRQAAWLIPLMYILHLAEEYFMDLAGWYSQTLGAELSMTEFFYINLFGFLAILLFAVLYSLDLSSNFVMWVFNSIFFANGILHIIASLFTLSYSPGAFTGLLVLIPLGWVIYGKLKDEILNRQRFTGTLLGVMILLMIAMISYNI